MITVRHGLEAGRPQRVILALSQRSSSEQRSS
jgi:hypothetical protein